mgnify:CR=1 FL=1
MIQLVVDKVLEYNYADSFLSQSAAIRRVITDCLCMTGTLEEKESAEVAAARTYSTTPKSPNPQNRPYGYGLCVRVLRGSEASESAIQTEPEGRVSHTPTDLSDVGQRVVAKSYEADNMKEAGQNDALLVCRTTSKHFLFDEKDRNRDCYSMKRKSSYHAHHYYYCPFSPEDINYSENSTFLI